MSIEEKALDAVGRFALEAINMAKWLSGPGAQEVRNLANRLRAAVELVQLERRRLETEGR